MPPQLMALAAALSYATCTIAAKRGMQHSTPVTVTLVSLAIHTTTLWTAVFLTGGIPPVAPLAVILFIVAGTLQPIIRLFTYSGIHYVGASRGTTLRGTHPLFSTTIAILVLGEQAGLAVIAGTILIVVGIALISWQPESQLASFHWWHLAFPLGAALLAGIVHPIRRYALGLSNHPLFFAALVGLVSLLWLGGYLSVSTHGERPVWNRRSLGPFLFAGTFETLGILLGITALSYGPVVLVSPLIATSPLWVLFGSLLFLRGIEKIALRTVLGALCVVSGTIAISLIR
jgi:drug/metabolite transporter (DMT)-like permease